MADEPKTIKAPLDQKKLAKLADEDGNVTFRLELELASLIQEEELQDKASEALIADGGTIEDFECRGIEFKKKGTVAVLEFSGNVSDSLPQEEEEGDKGKEGATD